ncbi:hypothetical protein BTJ68_10391 [Hortaea werneckii EXF-2000]|uniref:Uncharacterized protein n=1 Tax=Hortaea werneckii EXF-2000 TaxID=1157616 RepID=A0A1Z5T006_HORWE|nr:hypothetical protein BTJ68_10391 [Hortaea werneckii EXF-2000]
MPPMPAGAGGAVQGPSTFDKGPIWQADDHATGPLQEVAVSYALNKSEWCNRRKCTDRRGYSAQRI